MVRRRYGLNISPPQTLEDIGRGFGITRERVRQIADDGMTQIQEKVREQKQYRETMEAFGHLAKILRQAGHVRREDLLLQDVFLEASENPNHAVFLLHLGDQFVKHGETIDVHSFWTTKAEALDELLAALNTIQKYFEQTQKVATIEEVARLYAKKFKTKLTTKQLTSYLEISKHILQGPEGTWGLRHWPEVNPRGIKDKAYLVLKSAGKPVHFTEVAEMIQEFQKTFAPNQNKACLPQTVHNELIKDKRFVLVGRGTYGLSDWGYRPGTVRDIIMQILKDAGKPMAKDDIIKKTLKERHVKENTIVLNLQNKEYFTKDKKGKYQLKV